MTLNELLTEHYNRTQTKNLKRIRYAIGNEHCAEDVLHDAYERAIKYISSFDGTKEFDRWFSLIVRNAIRDWLRNQDGFGHIDLDEYDHEGDSCTGYFDKIGREIENLIAKKKDEGHREVLTLYFQLGYTAIDISRVTDNSYANCNNIIRRFKDDLKELYGD